MKSFHKIQRTSFLSYNFQPRIGNVEEFSVAGRSQKKEKCYTIIFWVILLFFHLSHNSKDNFSPLFNFTLLKRKKGIFLRFKTLLQFYRGKIIQEPGLPYKSRKRRLSLDLKSPVPISSHITKLVLGFYKAMKAFIPYNFVAANSRLPIWSTEEKVQNQYYRRRRDKKSVNCCKSHIFIILSQQST